MKRASRLFRLLLSKDPAPLKIEIGEARELGQSIFGLVWIRCGKGDYVFKAGIASLMYAASKTQCQV